MWAASSLQTVQKFWEDRVEGPEAGLGRSWVGAWIHLLRQPPLCSPRRGGTRVPGGRQAPDRSVRSPQGSCCRPEEAGPESCSPSRRLAGPPCALALYIYPECSWLLLRPSEGSPHTPPSATAGTAGVEKKSKCHTHTPGCM